MRSKAAAAAVTSSVLTTLVLAISAPAFAGPTVVPEPVPTDNSRWTAVIAILVVAVVVGGMLFLANAYRKKPPQ